MAGWGLPSVLFFESLSGLFLLFLLLLYFCQFLLNVFLAHVFPFNFSGRAKKQIGRQCLYGELLDGRGIPSGEITTLFPLQGISFDCFFPFLFVNVQGDAPEGE